MVDCVSHNDHAARGDHRNSERLVEAGSRARAVSECSAATARKRRDNTEGRHEPDAMVELVCHDDHATRGDHSDSEWLVEARSRTRAVGKTSATAARERCDNAQGRHKTDAVIDNFGNDDHAARRDHSDSGRLVEAGGRARTVGKRGIAAASERRDDAEGCHETDAVVIPISHDDHAARRDHGDSRRAVEARGHACAVGEGGAAAARKCRDGAAACAHDECKRLWRRSLLRISCRAPLEHGRPRRRCLALDPRTRAEGHAATARECRGRTRARHAQIAAAGEHERATCGAKGIGGVRGRRAADREGRDAFGRAAREVEGRVSGAGRLRRGWSATSGRRHERGADGAARARAATVAVGAA